MCFTPEQRERLRKELVSAAYADTRVTGAAVTGSAAVGREDRWSDIDLALCVAADADGEQVLADWTDRMYREHAAVHHVDVTRGVALYRVFLLTSTLQVDLAFWPAAEFGAIAPAFRLLFGTANERPTAPAPVAAELIGMGWLYAPPQISAPLTGVLVCSLDIAELRRAFGVISEALLIEIELVDADLANRLAGPLRELIS